MKITKILFGILVLVLLGGCSIYPPQQTAQENRIIQEDASLHEATPSLSATGFSPTSLTNEFRIQMHCPDDKFGTSELPGLPGTLVFSADNILTRDIILSPEPGKNSILSFWQPQLNRILSYDLEEEEAYYYAESPNQKKLALTQAKTATVSHDLIVLDNQGQELGRRVVPNGWTFFHWLNNDQILLERLIVKEKFDLVTIRLADQKQQALPTNFPNIYLSELFWDWGSQILFNPEATLALYPVLPSGTNQVYSVLWSIKENKEVARIAGSGWVRWSPDGRRFLLIDDAEDAGGGRRNEIFLINAAGLQYRATFFTEDYERSSIILPIWSPDGRYVAFWLVREYPIKTAQLGVLDTEALTVDLFCKEIDPYPIWRDMTIDAELGYVSARLDTAIPIWSPDSKYLLIEDNNGIESSTYLYDLHNFTTTKIADKARPVGWLR